MYLTETLTKFTFLYNSDFNLSFFKKNVLIINQPSFPVQMTNNTRSDFILPNSSILCINLPLNCINFCGNPSTTAR